MIICNVITGMISFMSLCTLHFWYIFCMCPNLCFPLSLSVPATQRSVCSPREDELRVCVQTPTADSSPSLLTISMRCSKSTPWCDALSKLSPLTDWTALVRPAYVVQFLSCLIGRLCLSSCLVVLSLSVFVCLFLHKSIVSAIMCCMTCMLSFLFFSTSRLIVSNNIKENWL